MLSIGKTISLVVPFVSYVAYNAAVKAPYSSMSCSLIGIGCPTDIPFHGFVEDEYKEVYDLFLENFKNGDDVGASISAYVDGHQVLSLQGGWQDRENNIEYTNNTLQMAFSSTKTLVSCFHTLTNDLHKVLNYQFIGCHRCCTISRRGVVIL